MVAPDGARMPFPCYENRGSRRTAVNSRVIRYLAQETWAERRG
jgi:hypothetical protein